MEVRPLRFTKRFARGEGIVFIDGSLNGRWERTYGASRYYTAHELFLIFRTPAGWRIESNHLHSLHEKVPVSHIQDIYESFSRDRLGQVIFPRRIDAVHALETLVESLHLA